MKRQVLFAFGLLTFLNSHAMPPMYRRAEQILVEGKPVSSVQSVYNRSFYALGSEAHNFDDFLVTQSEVTNINKLFPQYRRIDIGTEGGGVRAASWQTEFKRFSGYYQDGKLTEVAPWAWNGVQGPLYMTGGGGNWIGGYTVAVGTGNPYRTVGLAYNPKSGERIDIKDRTYNQFVGANFLNTWVYMSDFVDIGTTFNAGHAIRRVKNGVKKTVAYGYAFSINDRDQILFANGHWSLYIVEADGTLRELGSKNTSFEFYTEAWLDNFGTTIATTSDGLKIANGDTWYDLDSRIEGGYSLDSVMVDPATGSIYGKIKGRESEGIYRFDPVPEPGTLAALGLGAVALLRKKRRA